MPRTPHRTVGQSGNKKARRRKRPDLPEINFAALSRDQLIGMMEAGHEVLECQRALAKGGSNVVAEVLPRQGTFYQFDHCPAGDVYDRETHSQYYYHAHRSAEHGHFHTFLRQAGMPPGVQPVKQSETGSMKARDDKLSHLVAISMDKWGIPIGLFTTNRWVTDENWYAADDVAAMLDCFVIDHAQPSWATNRWVTAMLRLFQPQIVALLHRRDAEVAKWQKQHAGDDVFEDRRLDLPSRIEISLGEQLSAIQAVLGLPSTGSLTLTPGEHQ